MRDYKKKVIKIKLRDWKKITIGDVCLLEYGSALKSNHRQEGKYPVFGSNGIVGYHKFYNVEGPAIIIGRKGSIGSVHFSLQNCWAIDTTYFVKFKNDKEVDIKYLFYYLKKLNLSKLAIISTIPGINRELIYKKQIILPPLHEQRKIAEILSTVDKAIEIIDKKIEKLEKFKRGMMQKLLTKGIGHKRFKKTEIGEIPEEWEVKRLEEVAEIKSGGNAPQGEEYFINGNKKFVRVQHILVDSKYIKEYDLINDMAIKKYNLVEFPKGSIIFPKSGASILLEKRAILPFDAYVVNHLAVIIPSNKIDCAILYYLLKKYKFSNLIQATTLPYLNLDDIGRIKIIYPPLPEQRKIAEILSFIDSQIDSEKQRKQKYETLKKGLMNDLLTGKRRVK